ncbi:MAG: elongation factor P [Chitinispirillaceae bacterium]|nr:elongation factor P [Chitinispirillaceae bacterium]
MFTATQIRKGMIILHNGEPHRVLIFRFTVRGRGSNQIFCKMRNVITGSSAEYRFRSDDKVEQVEIDQMELEYLYEDGGHYWFMDMESFDQFSLERREVEEVIGYVLPNTRVKGDFYEGKCIGITPPNSVHLKVVETEPAIKGATASGNVTKPAKLETGLVIQVPMFVSQDDVVIVNTSSGDYQGRPGKG